MPRPGLAGPADSPDVAPAPARGEVIRNRLRRPRNFPNGVPAMNEMRPQDMVELEDIAPQLPAAGLRETMLPLIVFAICSLLWKVYVKPSFSRFTSSENIEQWEDIVYMYVLPGATVITGISLYIVRLRAHRLNCADQINK
jgi:hypothetical protein